MKKRYYKDIERAPFSFVFEDSPLELIDRTACYDIESFEYFLKVRMKNVSSRPIASVKVRISLYQSSNVPYKKINYVYKVKGNKKASSDIIGENDYIPLPESFYKSLDFTIVSVTFADGETLILNLSSSKKPKLIAEQPSHIVTACELIDDSESIRDKHPAIIFPQFGESAWICCCSHKNRAEAERCEVCTRGRDDLKEAFSMENLNRVAYNEAHGVATMTQRRVKGEFLDKREPRVIDTQKENLIEEQKKKVEKRERYKDKMRIQALPRIALYFVLAYLLYFLLCWIFGILPQ